MRKLAILIVIAVLVVFGILFFREQTRAASIGTIDILRGSADIVRGEQATEAKTGTEVRLTDAIKVADGGRAAIILKDGSVFRLEAGSTVRIEELLYNGDKLQRANVDIEEGKIWWNTMPLSNGGNVEVETPTLVATVRGTSFNTSYLNKTSTVYVSTHTVIASLQSDRSKALTLTGGMLLEVHDDTAKEDFAKGPVFVPQWDKNDWILFNEREDRRLALQRGENISSMSSASSIESGTSSLSSRRQQASVAANPTSSVAPVIRVSSISSKATVSSRTSSGRSSVTSSKSAAVTSSSAAPATQTLTRLALTAEQTQLDINQFTILHVTAFYSDGSKKEIQDATWSIEPANGTIENNRFLAKKSGTVFVVAQKEGMKSNYLEITVREPQAPQKVLESLTINYTKVPPPDGSRELPTATFSVIANYSDGSTADVTPSVGWDISGTAQGTITQKGEYKPGTQGTDTVTASFEQKTGSAQIVIP